jgi:hypothetical protein
LQSWRQGRRSQHALQDRANTDGEQGLLGIAQKIDHSTFGVAQENALTVGEQMQTGAAREQIG